MSCCESTGWLLVGLAGRGVFFDFCFVAGF